MEHVNDVEMPTVKSDDPAPLSHEEMSTLAAIQGFLSEDLVNVRSLGYGSQGEVKLMKAMLYGKVAVKKFLSSEDMKYAMRELVLSQRLSYHPHILSFYGFFYSKEPMDGVPNGFVMEYMEDGNLHGVTIRDEYHLRDVLNWTRQAAMALAYCHKHHVFHRDVKPGNMLLSRRKEHLKICDFGSANQMDRKRKMAGRGTIKYMSPEMMVGMDYDSSVDVYSLGMSIWQMIYKQVPFDGASDNEVCERVVRRDERPSMSDQTPPVAGVDKQLKSIISRCWDTDPKIRPTMVQLLKEIEPLCILNNLDPLLA